MMESGLVKDFKSSLKINYDGLKDLLNFNWQDLTENDALKKQELIQKIITDKIGVIPFIVQEMDNLNNTKYYRARIYEESININLIQEFYVPPKSICSNYQRANIPLYPVFYCSKVPTTAIIETFLNRGQSEKYFYLSEWILKSERNLFHAPFVYKEFLIDDFKSKNLGTDISVAIKDFAKDLSNDEFEFLKKYLLSLYGMFLTNDNNYTISSYLAHAYLYANHNLRADFISYPSIAHSGHGLNFAFNPNSSFELLKLSKIYKCRLEILDDKSNQIKITVLEVGQNINSIIFWKKSIDDNEKLYLNNIFKGLKITI